MISIKTIVSFVAGLLYASGVWSVSTLDMPRQAAAAVIVGLTMVTIAIFLCLVEWIFNNWEE